jgi:hypothetical protein
VFWFLEHEIVVEIIFPKSVSCEAFLVDEIAIYFVEVLEEIAEIIRLEVVGLKIDLFVAVCLFLRLWNIERIKIIILCDSFGSWCTSLRTTFRSSGEGVEIKVPKIVVLGLRVVFAYKIAKISEGIVLNLLISTDFFFF